MESGEPESGPHAYMVRASSIELSLDPNLFLIMHVLASFLLW